MTDPAPEPEPGDHLTVTHRLDPDQLTRVLGVLVLGSTPLPPAEGHAAPCGHEPWEFYSPHHKVPAAVFVEPATRQLHYIPVTRIGEQPKTWQRVYLAPPAGTPLP